MVFDSFPPLLPWWQDSSVTEESVIRYNASDSKKKSDFRKFYISFDPERRRRGKVLRLAGV